MTEKQLELKVTRYIRSKGGLAIKTNAAGQAGIPDRQFIGPAGICFVEFKAPGKLANLTNTQKAYINILKDMNAEVGVFDNYANAIHFIEPRIFGRREDVE